MNDSSPCVLAGDVGGTKTLLLLAESSADGMRTLAERRFENRDYPDFSSLLRQFLDQAPWPPDAACFAIAGPVAGNRADMTNLPWLIDGVALTAELGFSVRLVNDFEAVGYGIDVLGPDDLETLQEGEPQRQGVRAVLGAGTGLGEGFMVWQGEGYKVFPSEGSHADFAPADEKQDRLLHCLRKKYGHVSWERVVSGPGLADIYGCLGGDAAEPAHIADAAQNGSDARAAEALELFVAAYGAEAGNLALKLLPRGGVYVAGGIAPQILPTLKEGGFLDAFRAKGRFAGLLASIPVHVVKNPKVGLLGAALVASTLL
ncbi:MAG: glucokinase [Sulfuricellaceae bacterium]